MKALTLTLKAKPTERVDMSPVTPDTLRGKDAAAIAKIKLQCGNRTVRLDSLFDLTGADSDKLHVRKSTAKLDNLGAGMGTGSLSVHGAAGDRVGAGMSGGQLTVRGDVADWLGTGMKNGRIDVLGNAGCYAAAAWPGDPNGMRGGIIRIAGSVDERAGDRMRRGTLIIEGDAAAYCGARMLAGTIVVCGKTGDFTGFAMKRGTIVLNKTPKQLLSTFNHCGHFQLGFLPLLFSSLCRISPNLHPLARRARKGVNRYAGDLSTSGKGELLILG